MEENKITIFTNPDFGEVRTLNVNGVPWFVGKDVADILGYSNSSKAVSVHVDEEDKTFVMLNISHSQNGNVPMGQSKTALINESGLYSLILGSKLPTAKKFKSWITSEVLPTLRKTGTYSIKQKPDSYTIEDPIARAKRWIEEKEQYIALENKVKADEPLVEFANHIQSSKNSISMNDMAKLAAKNGIKIGRNRLFKLLRAKGILDDRNVPYQRYIEGQPWFEVNEFTYYANGQSNLSIITNVTPRGQIGIVRMLKGAFKNKDCLT